MGKGARLLVVEDDPDMIRILSHFLQTAGYEVVPAYGVEDALRKLMKSKFDLVLTDLAMPKVTGVTLIREIKGTSELQDLPVVVVTAHVWSELGQAASQAGCDGFVAKPFTAAQLTGEVEKCLHLRGKARHPSGPLSGLRLASSP